MAFACVLSGFEYRLYTIICKRHSMTAEAQGKRVESIAQSRGYIYDKSLSPLVNNEEGFCAFVANPKAAYPRLLNIVGEDKLLDYSDEIKSNRPFTMPTRTAFSSDENIYCLEVRKRYGETAACVHLIGYINSADGQAVCGLEKSFDSFLSSAQGELSVEYLSDGYGNALKGEGIRLISDGYDNKSGLLLTIDRSIQLSLERLAQQSNIKCGAAVVLDAHTSAIVAIASWPKYDRSDLASALDDEKLPFLDRSLNAYSVGSVFKPIVAAAALEDGILPSKKFICRGSVTVGAKEFFCHKRSGHGEIDMGTAIAESCNSYFVQLALELGAAPILSLCRRLGLDGELEPAEGISTQGSVLPTEEQINSSAALANLSFGQGSLLCSILHMAAIYACFADRGSYKPPYVLSALINDSGEITARYEHEEGRQAMSEATAQTLLSLLRKTVVSGSGQAAEPDKSSAFGKTATAQSGSYSADGEILRTWFVGGFPSYAPDYIIAIINEDGSSPMNDCIPLFKSLADSIIG